jgi:hypothetical protein
MKPANDAGIPGMTQHQLDVVRCKVHFHIDTPAERARMIAAIILPAVLGCAGLIYAGCVYEPPVSRVTIENCATACTTLRRLDCPEGKPTPKGAPCEAVCEGNAELLEIVCVTQAKSVEAVRLCNVRCRQ